MQVHTLTNHSMWIFSPTSRPRVWAFTLVQHQAFELLVLAAIVFNCVLLAMDDSSVDANSDLRLLIDRTDIAFGMFFLAEMLVKLLAWGGWWCGEQYVTSSPCLDYLRGASVSLCSFLVFLVFVVLVVSLLCSLCSLFSCILLTSAPQLLLSIELESTGCVCRRRVNDCHWISGGQSAPILPSTSSTPSHCAIEENAGS